MGCRACNRQRLTGGLTAGRISDDQGREESMLFWGKDHKIRLSALMGMLLLAVLLLGAQGNFENNPAIPELMDSVKQYHRPLQEAEPLKFLSSARAHASTTPHEKGGQLGRPAAPPGRASHAVNRPESSLDPGALRQNAHANVNYRIATQGAASQKAHREGIYAVILMALASSRH